MKNEDLALRNRLIEEGKLEGGYNPEMESLHNKNAEVLNEIINRIGYPTVEKVGKEGNDAAWLVIQHAISQPEFMKRCLRLLEEVASEDESQKIKLAYLADRIAVFGNKPQLYGTQFDWDENGELSPNLFDDLSKVDQRRHSIGMNTLAEQTDLMRKQAEKENRLAPTDFEKRKEEMELWRRKVGWVRLNE